MTTLASCPSEGIRRWERVSAKGGADTLACRVGPEERHLILEYASVSHQRVL